MIRLHVDAILARLRLDQVLKTATYDGEAKNGDGSKVVTPYCVVYADQGRRSSERQTASQTRVDMEFTVHSVGTDRAQAHFTAERVYAQLLGFKPSITGRSCWPITAEISQPVRLDKDVSPPLFLAVDVFRLSSIPVRSAP